MGTYRLATQPHLRAILRKHRWIVAGVIALGTLASLAEGIGISLFIPFLHALYGSGDVGPAGNWLLDGLRALSDSIRPQDRPYVISGLIFISVLLKATLILASSLLSSWLDVRVGHDLRTGVFDQFLRVDYAYLESGDWGHYLNILASDTWRTGQAIATWLTLVISVISFCVYGVVLLLLSVPLTLLVGGAMIIISLVVRRLTRRVEQLGREATDSNARLAKRMLQGFGGLRVIRLFGRERYEVDRFSAVSEQVSRSFYRLGVLSSIVSPAYEVLTACILVVLLVSVAGRPQDLPALLVFAFILYRMQPKIQAMDAARIKLVSLAASSSEVVSFMDTSDKPYMTGGDIVFNGLEEGIRFENVSFYYGESRNQALDRIRFEIPAGKITAVVGPSGAGKTTLLNLLTRMYDPSDGRILVDGVPLASLDMASWRAKISVVSQDVFLFDATVRENLVYGRPEASDEEIWRALRLADADSFVAELPAGLETRMGELGARLSGGQRQRISLARAVLRDPDILILDEATNSLDSLSEQLIRDSIGTLRDGRTIILVAHRFSTIEQADHVVVIEAGEVREQGTIQDLIERNGLFARLYRMQFGKLAPL